MLFSAGMAAQEIKLQQPVRFLALGDSYTAGTSVTYNESWPVQLYERLGQDGFRREKIEIIAKAGWRTDNLLNAIREYEPADNYNLVSLLIGVNNQYQGGSAKKYEKDFNELIIKAISLAGNNSKGVFVLSIPDYSYTPFGEGFTEASSEIDKFNEINRSISSQYNVAYFDITQISRMVKEKPGLLANDGLHPSGEMYGYWVDLIIAHIRNSNPQENKYLPDKGEDKLTATGNKYSGIITLFMPGEGISSIDSVSLYMLTGQALYRSTNSFMQSDGQIILNIPGLKNGLYIVEVISGKKRFVTRLII
ncbi:MAG TPA: GDSL-type esterase/lipase family protein [Bacteroidales bacterium]|nr:GDSL-type esterase/lipase family protein [Bacteroidales bacterium]